MIVLKLQPAEGEALKHVLDLLLTNPQAAELIQKVRAMRRAASRIRRKLDWATRSSEAAE